MPKTPASAHACTRRHPRKRLRAAVCKAKRNGLRRYEYDAANRLANVTTGAGVDAPTTRYVHNALGQRLFKTEPQFAPVNSASNPADPGVMQTLLNFFGNLWGSSITGTPTTTLTPSAADQLGFAYYYDEDGSLLYEQGTGGASSTGSAHYVYLPTPAGPMPIATYTGARHYAVHTDHLNTPRRLTQSNKTVAWQWAFSAFGDEQPTTARNRFVDIANSPSLGTTTVADVTFNLRYPGQYFDKESGLHFNWMRSYSPNNGRYTQADPIDLQGGWNRFAYVENNPLSFVDPEGLQKGGGARTTNARDAAGYHDPRGDFICQQWSCPGNTGTCGREDQRNPTDFLPPARRASEPPAGCTCARLGYQPDWTQPTPEERDIAEAYNKYKEGKELWPRVRDGLGKLPHWHRLGGYGK